MEISKSLFAEILAVQQKLHSAILEHQTSVEKLKNDPNNQSILGQIKKIQVHIVTLGKCQNQIVQRLRKEVESKADNANGSKISIPSLLGLNNNNHITNNNETKHEAATNGFETKEDYEEVVRNGDVHGSQDNDCAKLRPSSVETVSGEDEDIVEVSLDENSDDKQEVQKEEDIESPEKYDYLYRLGLITKSKCIELQNRRVERKRRSTANPQFVYSLFEQPSKRKRYSYLQSGNAPHTRQTTARINGPSPPPSKTQSTKSTSPPAQTITKSLIPVQKSTTRPNILRNADSKVFVNKNKTEDNQMQLSIPSAKSVQSMNNKAVHIPGLPSSLTIERIGSDSIVCICCENPGSLTTCKNCSSNYHISCHIRSSPPSRICPKCTLAMDEEEDTEKDEVGEIKEEMEDDNKLLRYKKDEKFEEKERERYELRERNSDLRLQVYELEKRSQLLGQSLQLQQRTRQDLLAKQEKTQRSIKRLVDFIKLIQLRKNTSSPPSSASISCLPQPSSSRSPRTMSPPQTSVSQRTSSPRSSIPNTDKTSYIATITSSVTTHGRTSPTSKKRCPTPINCQVPPVSSQKNINHISLSKKSPNQLEGPISLLAVKPKTNTAPQPTFSTTNCRPVVAALPFNPVSIPSSPIPCSTIVTTVRNKPIVQSHSNQYQNCQILFTPSRTTISWTEQPSMARSPGPNSHAASSVSINQPDQQKSYCLLATTSKITATNSNGQDQPDQQKKQLQRISMVIANTDQETSSTHCSQAITSPIPSPVVHASHEASAQTTETVRSCDNSSVVRNTNWNCASSQKASQQQQSSSSGTLSRDSSST
ncbi:mucin-5AC isoform X2 [Monomorium pharaonis]|uniref:mucin-5AC isoform X2 n=1 Tax=Monomorium pharaonis TaxID=307658 RepID=UPI00063F16A8|nr:mucin-5AC isoform X2 [Monomorium pharaonis]